MGILDIGTRSDDTSMPWCQTACKLRSELRGALGARGEGARLDFRL